MAKRTPLYDQHIATGAHTFTTNGWLMPLHYGSQFNEHHAVRKSVGLSDISHITIIDISGCDAREYLRQLLANDVARLTHPGAAQYSLMLNEAGGILDDLIIYFLDENHYRLIFNAVTRHQDQDWLKQHTGDFDVSIQPRNDLAMLSLQGPKAAEKLKDILPPPQQLDAVNLKTFQCRQFNDCFIARTGYTGEDGFEIVLPAHQVIDTWQTLIDAGIQPVGLAARDTLRVEAGFNHYGQDMDQTTSPYAVNLGWVVAWQPADRRFIGREALTYIKHQNTRQLVGLVHDDRGVMRRDMPVSFKKHNDGIITSGVYSPSLSCSIALAHAPLDIEDEAGVFIHGREVRVRVTKPVFLRHGQSMISQEHKRQSR